MQNPIVTIDRVRDGARNVPLRPRTRRLAMRIPLLHGWQSVPGDVGHHCSEIKRMELVEVTVHYLEMLAPSHRSAPAARDGLTVLHVQSPTVPYYRSIYNAVGQDFYWLSRRKLSDEALAAIIG